MSVLTCQHKCQFSRVNTNVSSHVSTQMSGLTCQHKCQFSRVNTNVSSHVSTQMSVLTCQHKCRFSRVNTNVSSHVSTQISVLTCQHKFQFSQFNTNVSSHVSTQMSVLTCQHKCQFSRSQGDSFLYFRLPGLYNKQLRGSAPTFRTGTLLHVRFHFLKAGVADMVLRVRMNPEGHHWIMPKFRFGVDTIPSTM